MSHRYKKLGYVALNVSNIGRSVDFYERLWGLQSNGQHEHGPHFLRCSEDHHNVVLYQGVPGLKRIGWQLESERDIDIQAEALKKYGLPVEEVDIKEAAALRQGRTIRFIDPFTRATHEYYAEIESGNVPWAQAVAKIQRLGHVALKTTRYEEALRFYQEVLNFRISDRINGRVTFLRCWPNPYHHSLALTNSSGGSALHHVNFMVSEIDDVGKGMWRFQNNNVPIVWGPGRHPPSGSVFLYVLDPDGLTVEYSYGMECFPEEGGREHRILPPVLAESGDFWGAPMDRRYGAIGEIETPQADSDEDDG